MNLKLLTARMILLLGAGALSFLYRDLSAVPGAPLTIHAEGIRGLDEGAEEEEEDEEKKARFNEERLKHEWQMLRNPVTGRIPKNIRATELRVARSIPSRKHGIGLEIPGIEGTEANNPYVSVGPNNVAGRSRQIVFDRRNRNIAITGGTTGGIFRSTNGGATWTFVSPENDIRSVNTIAQDPANPQIWYVGTGEVFYPVSTADIAGTFGHGIFKSEDNGLTWAKLPGTVLNNDPNQFEGQFDLVHRIAVHPTTGDVFAAIHNRIVRSSDGGATWQTVLGGTQGNTALTGLCEVIITPSGNKIFAAFSGENSDRALAGVWESSTGAANGWRRIAGGPAGAADSVAGWEPYQNWERPVLALNNAGTQLFVLYKNSEEASGSNPEPEADLFRATIGAGNPTAYTWSNLSAWVPDEPGFDEEGIDPYTTQFNGFNMSIRVKPDNDNILFIGGTNLHRVNLATTNAAQKFRRMGGYGRGFFPDEFFYPGHHPDVHFVTFAPGENNLLYTASDGGIHRTLNPMADTVEWEDMNTDLQTLQYQFVNIVPDPSFTWIIGGAQDNGTLVNVNADVPGPAGLEHLDIGSGDGSAASIGNFTKTGNNWKQPWFLTVVNGTIYRSNFSWQLSGTTLNYVSNSFDNVTPSGLGGQGQWFTLLVSDQDSTEQLYYNNRNRLYRTRTSSTVTATNWTQMTGVSNAVGGDENFTSMAISKRGPAAKYLYFGTDAGKVYRLNNANITAASTAPVDITPDAMVPGSYVANIAINPRNADTVLLVVSNYDDGSTNSVKNIFWTGNATSANPDWVVLDGSLGPLSSQSCEIVVKNSGVEYYVGTSAGLYSATAVNGNSTAWFNEGTGMLKKAIVRSLKNRQADNTLVVGTHGNGAFIARIGDAVTINELVTGINPVINDRNFIRAVYPTLVNNAVVRYETGSMIGIRSVVVQVYNIKGQQVYVREQPYQNGTVDVRRLQAGNYILTIQSTDGRYKHIQKLIKP
ncbi:MAG TPA: T9SS type A sorting domain-containing protein [Chitinophagaceae bacterium]|jgi:hypothetical protein|nr:T9SS type A sorting domain-containing protein [Chitinophagaceae bacterium]